MDTALRILFILLIGFVAKHATQRTLVNRVRPRHRLNIWCIYGIAGCSALAVKMTLRHITDWHDLVIALSFGVAWGLCAGLLKATAKPKIAPLAADG